MNAPYVSMTHTADDPRCTTHTVIDTPVSPYQDRTGRPLIYGDCVAIAPGALAHRNDIFPPDPLHPLTGTVVNIRTSPYCSRYYVILRCQDTTVAVRPCDIRIIRESP